MAPCSSACDVLTVEAPGQQQEAKYGRGHAMHSSSGGVSVTMHVRRRGLDSELDIVGGDPTPSSKSGNAPITRRVMSCRCCRVRRQRDARTEATSPFMPSFRRQFFDVGMCEEGAEVGVASACWKHFRCQD